MNSDTGKKSIERVRLNNVDFERYRKYARSQIGSLKRAVDVRALKRIRPLPEFVTRDPTPKHSSVAKDFYRQQFAATEVKF